MSRSTFGTELHQGELLALLWQGVDWQESVLQVRQTLACISTYGGQGEVTRYKRAVLAATPLLAMLG